MTTEQIIGLSLALVVMLVGFAGCILPGLPGTPLILVAAIGHKLYFGAHGVHWSVLLILFVLTVLSLVLDYAASVYGAKRFGATWRGALGAVLGGLVGLFFSLPGIIIGPFLGALLFEMMGGFEFKKASRAGLGAVIGLFVGVAGKCALSVVMIGLFTLNVVWRS